jgi:hypothetical protein
MSESKDNTTLNKYLREKRMYCYYELKTARGGTFAFSKIEDNQDEGLPALERQGLVWKLSDEDSRKKPCDGFCTPPLPAYLVIKFDTVFCFIHYEDIQEMRASGRKSITQPEAMKIAQKIVRT